MGHAPISCIIVNDSLGLDHLTMCMNTETPQPENGFISLGVDPSIAAILTKIGITDPTPIQVAAIPVAIPGRDLIGIAQTGTGKTLAFTLPIIQKMLSQRGRALILLPTRELALQVEESIRSITRMHSQGIRTVCLIGGMPIYRQIRDLKQNPRLIIATPGRLWDHMEQKTIQLGDVTTAVLDEADRMLDMGFAPQIKRILAALPTEHQTLLFSATMPREIEGLAATYLTNPARVEVAPVGTPASQIAQEVAYIEGRNKSELLKTLLIQHSGTVLVFSRTKHGAGKLSLQLQDMGHSSAEIHSNRSLGQRRQALDGFKSGKYRILVATDIAARGIDVHDIELVINYDLPDAAEDYVHRIGRTGRAGKSGKAISFATNDQGGDIRAIERLMGRRLDLSSHSLPEPERGGYSSSRSGSRSPRYNSGSSSYSSGSRSSSSSSSYGDSNGTPRFTARPASAGSSSDRYGDRRPSGGGSSRPGSSSSARPSRGGSNGKPNARPSQDLLARIPMESSGAGGYFLSPRKQRD
jgi:ATP-dependent RNA helicase RhlE